MTPYRPQPGTIPYRVIEWLRQHPDRNPVTAELSEAMGVEARGFTDYMRAARDRGAVHTSRSVMNKHVLHWRLGDGRPDPTIWPHGRKDEDDAEAWHPPKFRAVEFGGRLLVTGMAIRQGVAVFEPEQIAQLKRLTQGWPA